MNKGFLVIILSLFIFLVFGLINSEIAIIRAEDTVRANPFLTLEEEESFKDLGEAIPIDYLNLSAIFYSPGASKVIINGYVLELNDNIDGKKVIDIQPNKVTLKDDEGEYVIRLRKIVDK